MLDCQSNVSDLVFVGAAAAEGKRSSSSLNNNSLDSDISVEQPCFVDQGPQFFQLEQARQSRSLVHGSHLFDDEVDSSLEEENNNDDEVLRNTAVDEVHN